MISLAASFDSQLSTFAPFLFYLIAAAVIFAETGLLFAFFLPGDSILFSAGLVVAANHSLNIALLVFIIFLAAFFGDQVGFVLGRTIGRPYLERKSSPRVGRMVARAERFYEANGWWAVTAARFFPWLRTFIPPVAGVAKMNYYKFLSANAIGALFWGCGITLAGYYSASLPWVKTSSYAIAGFFISASLLSIVVNYFRANRS